MTSYEIGDMFWGKSQSYPWWPCVIMRNGNNEIKRTRKKTGTQYHVQFIGPNYDVCWITNNFLIKYNGTENFESYVEQQLRSSLPPQHKLIYEMKMSGQIQAMWIQACQEAEKIHQLSNDKRTLELPKSDILYIPLDKKPRPKKRPSKETSKKSGSSSVSDTLSVDTKCIEQEENAVKESLMDPEIEEICRRVYVAEETENRFKHSQEPISHSELETMIKEQWNVLDIETKLLYLEGEPNNMSKSRVSGRRIKVPSRLRRTNELENIKKATLKKRNSDTISEKKKTSSSTEISLSQTDVKCENSVTPRASQELAPAASELNSIHRESLDSSVLKSLTVEESTIEILKIIVEKDLPIESNVCYQCLKPLKITEKYKICKDDCQSVFHLMCAINHKLFRGDDNNKCVNCTSKESLCCICKNSKYMKKQFLIKCEKPGCDLYFHSTCLSYLNLIEAPIATDKVKVAFCPNHTCLSCSRADSKHQCNGLGSLVTCTKCPISYHANLVCIPAGCRIMSPTKIICHRHFDNSVSSTSRLSRCFICFVDNATLRCCRCRAVFHSKCLNLPTYSDLLKDYQCTTCKLEQPMFYGQIVWIEIDNKWSPAEIVNGTRLVAIDAQTDRKSLFIRLVSGGPIRSVNSCELLSFEIGESVLRGLMVTDTSVIECAKKLHVMYLNWRKYMVPVTGDRFPNIGQTELLQLSRKPFNKPCPTDHYEAIRENQIDDDVKGLVDEAVSNISCSCSGLDACDTDNCHNRSNDIECNDGNCSSSACRNRRFAVGFSRKPLVTDQNVIHGLGVRILDRAEQGEILGELTGRWISINTALDWANQHGSIRSVYYVFCVGPRLLLDCRMQSNEWRHLNHSCSPNAQLVVWNVAGRPHVAVTAVRPIANEEVTIDYRRLVGGLVLKHELQCQCNLDNCSKFIGPTSVFTHHTSLIVPRCCIENGFIDEVVIKLQRLTPTKTTQIVPVTTESGLTRRPVAAPRASTLLLHDTRDRVRCHRCGCHGELILCNKASCQKRYHLQCVDLSTSPKQLWFCPKHYCMECGQAATVSCGHCSTSHCRVHMRHQKRHNCHFSTGTINTGSIDRNADTLALETVASLHDANGCGTEQHSHKSPVKSEKQESQRRQTQSPSKRNRVAKSRGKSDPELKLEVSSSVAHIPGPNPIVLVTKNDLYSACDLEPIVNVERAPLDSTVADTNSNSIANNNSNSPSPSQVNLTIKRPCATGIGLAANSLDSRQKKPRLTRTISNYTSADEEPDTMTTTSSRDGPERSLDDLSDIRCQIVPMGIEDNENLIVSPMVLDD